MKYAALIATVYAAGKWEPCTKQDCDPKSWICCDTKDPSKSYSETGMMLCTDPTLKGVVPKEGNDYAGWDYHCTTDQHKDYIDTSGGSDGASSLALGGAAVALSAYMLA